MSENLNELEMIGLAFMCGVSAGEGIKRNNNKTKDNVKETEIKCGKLEGKEAEEFIKIIKKLEGK